MKLNIIILCMCLLIPIKANCEQVYGKIEENTHRYSNQIIDSGTGYPVDNAKITIPQKSRQNLARFFCIRSMSPLYS